MSKEKKNSIDTLYEQTMLITKQLEELKREVMGEKTYSFTEKQLQLFSESLYENFIQLQSSQTSEIEFSSDYVEIELIDNVILATIDSVGIHEEIESNTERPTEKEMSNMVSEILGDMEMELR